MEPTRIRTELGKIEAINFGHGGYQDAMIGITVTLSGKGWGVCDHKGDWSIERSDYAKWSEEDRIKRLGEMVMWFSRLLNDAKKSCLTEMIGVPVEVTFDGNTLKSWRILTEVI